MLLSASQVIEQRKPILIKSRSLETNLILSPRLSGAMYGSIRPLSGDVIFAIEACKGECPIASQTKIKR